MAKIYTLAKILCILSNTLILTCPRKVALYTFTCGPHGMLGLERRGVGHALEDTQMQMGIKISRYLHSIGRAVLRESVFVRVHTKCLAWLWPHAADQAFQLRKLWRWERLGSQLSQSHGLNDLRIGEDHVTHTRSGKNRSIHLPLSVESRSAAGRA